MERDFSSIEMAGTIRALGGVFGVTSCHATHSTSARPFRKSEKVQHKERSSVVGVGAGWVSDIRGWHKTISGDARMELIVIYRLLVVHLRVVAVDREAAGKKSNETMRAIWQRISYRPHSRKLLLSQSTCRILVWAAQPARKITRTIHQPPQPRADRAIHCAHQQLPPPAPPSLLPFQKY